MTKINDIPIKEPSSLVEKAMLGFIIEEAARMGYGKLSIEVFVKDGKILHLESFQERKTFSISSIKT